MPDKPRILCAYQMEDHRPFFDILRDVADMVEMPVDQTQLEEKLSDCDAFFISLGLVLREALIRRCPRLKLVATGTTGTDHIDVKALDELGIRFICMKNDIEFLSQVSATAEMAWALLLAVARKLPAAFDSVKRGEWDRRRFRGRQFRGLTFGILGYGRLGKIIKDFALGFHMRVLAHDVQDFDPPPGIEKVDLETLLRESDVLSLHIHLTDENYHFLNRERMAMMKPGAILINTSRGACLDQDALIEALESGHIAGAGADVIEGEWEGDLAEHPMVRYAREHDNLVISPHVAGATVESMQMSMEYTMAKIRRALKELFPSPS